MNVISRNYKLYKVNTSGNKLIKEFSEYHNAVLKIRSILGLSEFRKCHFQYDAYTGADVYKDGQMIFSICKEITYDM